MRLLVLLVAAGLLAACSTGESGAPSPAHDRATDQATDQATDRATPDGPRIPAAIARDPGLALLRAAATGDARTARLAITAGADVEARDEHRRTPLLLAVTHDHVDVARVLLGHGASPDAFDDRHDTPWLVTGVTGSVPMAELLLAHDPDLTLRNRFGGVSIIPASERGHVAYVRRVATSGIDVNHVNDLGWTALLEAVILGDGSAAYVEIVRILRDAGADPLFADHDGVTALEHARARGQDAVAAVLE